MTEKTELSPEDSKLMTKYNIERETKSVFHSGGYKYDRLEDAVKYAKLADELPSASTE